MRDNLLKHKLFSKRILIISTAKLFLFSIIGFRYFKLQLLTTSKFAQLSDKNRLKIMPVSAKRGAIYDCDNVTIAYDTVHFTLVIDVMLVSNIDELAHKLSSILGENFIIDYKYLKHKNLNKLNYNYLILKENLSWIEVCKLFEADHLLNGIEVIKLTHRNYTFANAFAHILGYTSLPNKDDINILQENVSVNTKIGKIGIEKTLDHKLRGLIGYEKREVDAKGRFVKVISQQNPKGGDDVLLTVNAKLQCFIDELLNNLDLTASVVIMRVKNGSVLALHSTPSYNSNLFVNGKITKKDWDDIKSKQSNPLINHVISSAYPPGSTFKPAVAFSALINGFDPKIRHTCNGKFHLGSHIFKCWNPAGHGNIDLVTAIAQSCNPYFYNLGLRIGIDKLFNGAQMLGLGTTSGIELFGEIQGLMPNPVWKKQKFNLDWYLGDTVNCSIGQGFTMFSPLQIAVMTARIASGKIISPTLIKKDIDYKQMDIDPKVFNTIRLGMYNCVNSPSGALYNRQLSIGNYKICGKTGTAQVVALKHKNAHHHFKHHALFTSFAPYDDPEICVTMIVEHGEAGAKVGPIVKEIYNFILNNKIS